METSQSVCVMTCLWFITKIARLFAYNVVVSCFVVVVVVVWFLIISESAGELGLMFWRLTMEIPELRHWHYSDLYFVNSGHVFSRLPSQSYTWFL